VGASLVTAFLLSHNRGQEFHVCITRRWTLRWSDVVTWLRLPCPTMTRCNRSRSLVFIRLKVVQDALLAKDVMRVKEKLRRNASFGCYGKASGSIVAVCSPSIHDKHQEQVPRTDSEITQKNPALHFHKGIHLRLEKNLYAMLNAKKLRWQVLAPCILISLVREQWALLCSPLGSCHRDWLWIHGGCGRFYEFSGSTWKVRVNCSEGNKVFRVRWSTGWKETKPAVIIHSYAC